MSAAASTTAAPEVTEGFRGAMRRLASGVAIIVARGADAPTGMAATSITSLTMDPPAVLVCVNQTAGIHPHLEPGAAITVNLLSRHQKDVSAAFGGAVPRERRFEVGAWSADHHGLPMLDEAQANLSCTIDSITPYGTHSIVVARVEAVKLSEAVEPLIYQNGAYL
jgi:flavin reductase (DIM6/NTAB) family NADH-FMN oxidoreductase RutF